MRWSPVNHAQPILVSIWMKQHGNIDCLSRNEMMKMALSGHNIYEIQVTLQTRPVMYYHLFMETRKQTHMLWQRWYDVVRDFTHSVDEAQNVVLLVSVTQSILNRAICNDWKVWT